LGERNVPLAGGQTRDGPEDELFGLLQFSCGLPTPHLTNSDGSVVSRAVTVGDVRERRRSLRSWLIPPTGNFRLDLLTDIFENKTETPPHTWLLDLSRHAAVKLRDYSERHEHGPPPRGLPPALDWHRPGRVKDALWIHYLRVQRARDDSSLRFTKETDCNDFLIRDPDQEEVGRYPETGSLWELQLFFCEFLAQRRGAIFASHVSERIYNIWLPPGVIELEPQYRRPGLDSCFAVLPVVTVVRRPYRVEWRYALSLTMLLVPWWSADAGVAGSHRPRAMDPQEVVDVITSTSGNTTYLRDAAHYQWQLWPGSPLGSYLRSVTADDRRDYCSKYVDSGRPEWASQPLRRWIELLLMTAAERPRGMEEREDDRLPEQQRVDDKILPDEVLRCLRVNAIWSAMLISDSFPHCTPSSRLANSCWWPDERPSPASANELATDIPTLLSDLFNLFAERNHGFPPTSKDRIDTLAFGGRSYMTWRIPSESIMITAYNLADDEFPNFSALYQAGWFAYMAVEVTCALQTMYSLTHETDRLHDVAELSALGHNGIMDLEDVYEFDVAWPAYAEFYCRVRKMLGVDQEYAQIKERLALLFGFAQAEQRTREERLRKEEISLAEEEQRLALTRSHTIEGAAAVVGAIILLVSLANVVIDVARSQGANQYYLAAAITSLAIVAVGLFSFFWLRLRVRNIDRKRERARAALVRLAHVPRPGPATQDRRDG